MARNRGAAAAGPTDVDSATTQRMRIPTNGPHDNDTLGSEITPAPGTVDFGALRVPVPVGGMVSVEPTTAGRVQAVHVTVPEGRLSISALAAPRTGGLWADLATEIDASLREGGARVRSFTGEWGRELHATTEGATSVFVGVDGPRWMLYGVATGPTRDAVNLDARLRRMLRGTIVVRGRAPYPVRTVLPLAMPAASEGGQQAAASAPPTMNLRAPAAPNRLAITAGKDAANPAAVPTNGASPSGTVNGAQPQTTNGARALPAAAMGGAGLNGMAPNRMASGAAPTGAAAGAPATAPAPNAARLRRQAAAIAASGPGIPPPGGPTNGAHPTDAARTAAIRSGANRSDAATIGGNRTGPNRPGSSIAGGSPIGANPTSGSPIGGHPTGANRLGHRPSAANPVGANPAVVNPVGANPIGVDTTGAPPNIGATRSGAFPTGAGPITGPEPGTSPYGMSAKAAQYQTPTGGHTASPIGAPWGSAGPTGQAWSPPDPTPAGTTGSFAPGSAQGGQGPSHTTGGYAGSEGRKLGARTGVRCAGRSPWWTDGVADQRISAARCPCGVGP